MATSKISAPLVTPIAIPTFLLNFFNFYVIQFWHFFPITEKSENAQKLDVFVLLSRKEI